MNVTNNQRVLQDSESSEKKGYVGEQITLEKTVVLNNIPPGQYKLTVRVDDNLSKQHVEPSVAVEVR